SWRSLDAFARQNAVKTRGWIVFSPDSRMVALLENVRDVSLVDPATGRTFARLPTAGWPYSFSPDGTQLVTYGGSGGSFHVWDLRRLRRQLQEIELDWDSPAYPLQTE